MKTIKNTILTLAILMISIVGYANNETTSANVKRVKIEFTSVQKGNALTIKNDEETVIYFENVKKTGSFSKIFDFSALENGNYTIELDQNFETTTKFFSVDSNIVTFYEAKESKTFKPIIRKENNNVFISKFAFEANEMEVNIYYNDNLIYSEEVKENKIINRIYQLSDSKKGNYRIVVNADKKSTSKSFKL